MNRMALILLACLLAATAHAGPLSEDARALAAAGRLGEATRLAGALPSEPGDAAWRKAPAITLLLTPQLAVSPGLEAGPARSIELRALSNGTDIALRLAWLDATEDPYSTRHTARFADSLAVQFAPEEKNTLPYIGMGEPDHPVLVWFWRAGRLSASNARAGSTERLGARGFGTLAPIPGAKPQARAVRTKDGWAVVLTGPLPVKANPLALALATWDGTNAERNGRKHLSAWHLLHIPGLKENAARYGALRAESRTAGDAARGARLAKERGCSACHHLPGGAPVTVGPDLRLAGAQHWPGYLRRAIAEPSAFIVPGQTYSVGSGDKRLSLMPKLAWAPQDLEDLVAHLAELTSTVHGGIRQ